MTLSESLHAAPPTVQGHVKLFRRSMLLTKMVSHVGVLRRRRKQWCRCKVPRPVVIFENRHARRTETRIYNTLHVPDKHRLLDGVSQCHVLSFSGRECDTLVIPTKSVHACIRAHHSPTANKSPVSDLAGIARVANATSSTHGPSET